MRRLHGPRIAFHDDLLEKFYGLERYYDVNDRKELIGHLSIGLAPIPPAEYFAA